MRADRRDPIIASLRRFKGTKFEATLRDGTKKPIALSTKQNRWELLSDTLSVLPWTSIEALDDKGAVLGAIERDEDDEELIVDDDIARAERFAAIIAGAVANAFKEARLMFADSMKTHADMAVSMMESQRVLHESYSSALQIQRAALTQVQLGAGTNEDDKVMEMMKMAMALHMGQKPAVTLTTTPAPPKNGVKKP